MSRHSVAYEGMHMSAYGLVLDFNRDGVGCVWHWEVAVLDQFYSTLALCPHFQNKLHTPFALI